MEDKKLKWIKRFGGEKILSKATRDEKLKAALNTSLEKIYQLLEEIGKEYDLTCSLTDSKENLIKIEVKYEDRKDRDKIWDRAAKIISETIEPDRKVNILCGIYRLRT